MVSEYKVVKLDPPISIDGNWDKELWQKAEAFELKHLMGKVPKFKPIVKVKMMYDSNNLYIIFKVNDKCVRCVTTEINGPVWEDSCVEFFFIPDLTDRYFNLEINCGGTPLMYYNLIPRKNYRVLKADDIAQIEIAHTLPKLIGEEIVDSVDWVIEYRIPIKMLQKYTSILWPEKGVIWKANFYKIADKTSNQHYLTWSKVNQLEPDFHLPAYFGKLLFQ